MHPISLLYVQNTATTQAFFNLPRVMRSFEVIQLGTLVVCPIYCYALFSQLCHVSHPPRKGRCTNQSVFGHHAHF